MKSLRLFNDQAKRFVTAGTLLLATVVPALVPSLVSAATVTNRSVEMSTSAKGAEGVSYRVSFKAQTASTGAYIVDFCDSAVVGTTCTAPAGLDVTDVSTSGSDTVSDIDTNTVKVVLNTTAGVNDTVSTELTDITNPTDAGPIYARVVTYTNDTDASGYTDINPDFVGDHLDEGSVALSITDNIGVSGSVRESLIFCATDSGSTITSGCQGTLGTPTVVLGSGGTLTTTTSEGTIKTQISTNAAHGAVVSLKNSTPGGGLKRADAVTSEITPFNGTPATTIPDNSAKVGLKLAGLGAGTGGINAATGYSETDFFLRYAADNLTGVTSTYGDPIYNTNSAPVNDGTANLTFGANISNVTPAGTYSATLSLIATGTF